MDLDILTSSVYPSLYPEDKVVYRSIENTLGHDLNLDLIGDCLVSSVISSAL